MCPTRVERPHRPTGSVIRVIQVRGRGGPRPRLAGVFCFLLSCSHHVHGVVLLSGSSRLWPGTRPIVTRTVKAPTTKPTAPTGNLQKLPVCDKCGNGIVWVKMKEQIICDSHPEPSVSEFRTKGTGTTRPTTTNYVTLVMNPHLTDWTYCT